MIESTYKTCEECGGYRGVVFLNGTTEGDLVRLGLLHPCKCSEYVNIDRRTSHEKRTDMIIERLNTIIEQQSDIIALLKAAQPEQKLPKGAGPYLEGDGE